MSIREALKFPPGDNVTDTIINGIHFNVTTLDHWNYTLYSNETLSNTTWGWCILTAPPYTPVALYPNGTFVNHTDCYSPVYPIGARSKIGVAFGVMFGVCLITVLVNLAKHGKLYLPAEKRFRPIGRRWQWYWAIWVCVTGFVSVFTGIDVDRYYLPQLPIVLNVFFWFMMQWGVMASVWEAVRHWGSWMERQFIDPNPFVVQQFDRRGMFEFWLPLFFYFWLWMNFFLIIPRNWGQIELQRTPQQIAQNAIPAATDGRFKAAAFCLLICWLTIGTSAWHSIRHYEPRNRGLFNRIIGGFGYMPFRFTLLIPLSLAVVAYQEICAWRFDLSPLNVDTNLIAMYVGGYLPSLLILVVQIIAGYLRPNEDKALIQQRRERGDAIDRELGIVRKPAWWKRVNGDLPGSNMRDRIMRNVREVGGGRATARNIEAAVEARAREAEAAANASNNGTGIEMNEIRRIPSTSSGIQDVEGSQAPPPPYSPYTGKSDRRRSERTVQAVAGLLFPETTPQTQPSTEAGDRGRTLQTPPEQRHGLNDRSSSEASGATLNAPPQQVRSMLDV